MWYKEVMSNSRKNYIKPSPKDGIYNYRRGIPKQYRGYFRKPDGSPRGAEWKESLKTASKSTALVLAATVNRHFEHTLMLAKAEQASEADASKGQKVKQFISAIKREGIHPEQAPTVLAPIKEQQEWQAKLKDVLDYMYNDFENDALFDISGDPLDPTYTPNENYYLLEDQINFLEGKGDANIKSRLRPTLASATEEYIEQKVTRYPDKADAETKSKLNRVLRVTNSFASFIGGGSVSNGMDEYLDQIERSQAREWMYFLLEREGKRGSSVGRDMTILTAIYNLAVAEHSKETPDLRTDYNPFARLRTVAEEHHKEALRLGDIEDLSSRAWTPSEHDAFVERLGLMNTQLRLIAMLSIHTGARLKDTCGLRVDELCLATDEDSYIYYQANRNRKISKDSIERRVPLFGNVLSDLKSYVLDLDEGEENLFPRYVGSRQSDNASQVLNIKHLDTITKDKRFKMHGLRDTLSAKFLATNVPNTLSAYLVGWRDRTTVGAQAEYQRSGYPQEQLLKALKAAHDLVEWGTVGS